MQFSWIPRCNFVVVIYGNIGAKSPHVRYMRSQNLNDLQFDLSMSVKINSDDAVGLPIYNFLLEFKII